MTETVGLKVFSQYNRYHTRSWEKEATPPSCSLTCALRYLGTASTGTHGEVSVRWWSCAASSSERARLSGKNVGPAPARSGTPACINVAGLLVRHHGYRSYSLPGTYLPSPVSKTPCPWYLPPEANTGSRQAQTGGSTSKLLPRGGCGSLTARGSTPPSSPVSRHHSDKSTDDAYGVPT